MFDVFVKWHSVTIEVGCNDTFTFFILILTDNRDQMFGLLSRAMRFVDCLADPKDIVEMLGIFGRA